ncbi:MAG: autotransporter domain-containing protein [Alphaproteobacteria bacterium]|nr:autotransporter domain-containing protein [Alphaproteobacteria bacterium]
MMISPPARLRLALLAATSLAGSASAQTVTISANQTTPIITATASSGQSANVAVNAGISVTVTDGTAATINSANSLSNAGTITSSGSINAVGVRIDSAATASGSFTNNGLVSVIGTATGATGNIGLWVSGPGPFTGSIAGSTQSRFSVTGDAATGVLIAAPFVGDITLGGVAVAGTGSRGIVIAAPVTGNVQTFGTLSATGSGNTGLAILAPISGRLTSGQAIQVGADQGFSNNGTLLDAVAGVAGVRIAASIGGGFVNDRYFLDVNGAVVPPPAAGAAATAQLVQGSIAAFAGTPLILVAPAASDPVLLGAVGSGSDGFAIINRGRMAAQGRNRGTAQSGIVLGAAGLAPGQVQLAGGIATQTGSDISVAATDATAIGLELRAGAVVPAFSNAGSLTVGSLLTPASSSAAAGTGGIAAGVVVQAGASLASVVNSGSIAVQASGINAGFGIADLAGSITSISNSGSIQVAAASGQAARAIDLSAGSAAVTISNSGSIVGDVVGGNGATSVALTGGRITGRLALGSAANSLTMSGGAVITGPVSSGGALALTISGATALDLSATAPPTLSSLAMSGASTLTIAVRGGQPGLVVTGAASFADTSRLKVAVSGITSSQTLTLLTAAGGITAANAAGLVDTASVPFLYALGSAQVGANSVSVTLNRKTATQVGLASGMANFFDASLVALAGDATLGPAIGNLATQAEFLAAYRVLTPASFTMAPLRMAASLADPGQGAVAQRLTAIRLGGSRDELGTLNGLTLWIQESGNFIRQSDAANTQGFSGNMLGLAIGADIPVIGLDAVGVAYNIGWSDVRYGGVAGKPLLITTNQVDVYAAKRFGGFFVAAGGNYGFSSYSSRREFSLGTQTGAITAAWRGTSYGASGTLGYSLKAGRLAIMPSNSISWLTVQQNGFTETGMGSLALTMNASSQTITTNTAALSADYVVPSGDGAWRIGLRGGYVSQLGAAALALGGRFAGGGTDFVLNADAIRPSELQLGGQFAYAGGGFVAVLGYDRRQASGFTAQSLMASLRFAM